MLRGEGRAPHGGKKPPATRWFASNWADIQSGSKGSLGSHWPAFSRAARCATRGGTRPPSQKASHWAVFSRAAFVLRGEGRVPQGGRSLQPLAGLPPTGLIYSRAPRVLVPPTGLLSVGRAGFALNRTEKHETQEVKDASHLSLLLPLALPYKQALRRPAPAAWTRQRV